MAPDRWCVMWYGLWRDGDWVEGSAWVVCASQDAGATWSGAVLHSENWGHAASNPPCDVRAPRVAADDRGHLVATYWTDCDSTDGSFVLRLHRSTDFAATWSGATTVDAVFEPPDLVRDTPALAAADGQGAWAMVWASNHYANEQRGGDADIVVAFSTDGQTWTEPVAVNPTAPSDTVDDKPDAIVSIGPDQWLVAWSGSLGGDYGSDKEILLTRLAYPDCNHNGVPDDVELADGSAMDADGNGVPDECDPAPEPNIPLDGDQPGGGAGTADNGDSGQAGTGGQDSQPAEEETPPESRPALPCGMMPLAAAALVLLARIARTAAKKPA